MNTKDLQQYLGQEVLWSVAGIEVLCKVLDAKIAYGRPQWLIAPVAGSRCAWVREGLQFPKEGV